MEDVTFCYCVRREKQLTLYIGDWYSLMFMFLYELKNYKIYENFN